MWGRKLKTEQKDLKIPLCVYQPLHVSSVTPSHALTRHLTKANCNIMKTEQCWRARKVRNSTNHVINSEHLWKLCSGPLWNQTSLGGSLQSITPETTIAAWGPSLPPSLEEPSTNRAAVDPHEPYLLLPYAAKITYITTQMDKSHFLICELQERSG